MYGFSTKDEKEAYKAGIRKGEKNAAAMHSVNADALASLWAALGAANQTEAMEQAENFRYTNLQLTGRIDDLMKQRETQADNYKVIADRCNDLRENLDGAQRRINELTARADNANAAFNALSDEKSRVMEQLRKSEREINELILGSDKEREAWSAERKEYQDMLEGTRRNNDVIASQLSAVRYMSAHYLRERDKLDAKLGELINMTPPKPAVISANLGLATTAEMLAELQARAEVGGYAKYRTVDPAPAMHGGLHSQAFGRGMRPMPAEAPEIKDYAGFANKENFGRSGPAMVNKVPSPLEIETKKFVDAIQKLFNIS